MTEAEGKGPIDGLLFFDERPDSAAARDRLKNAGFQVMEISTSEVADCKNPPLLIAPEGHFQGLKQIVLYTRIPRERLDEHRKLRDELFSKK